MKRALPCMLFLLLVSYGTALADRPAIPSGIRTPDPVSPFSVKSVEVFLRNCAGTSCLIIGTLSRGDRIQLQETVREWVRVLNIDNGIEGWCKKSELSFQESYRFARVRPAVLNFRSCGGMRCTILTKLHKGQTMTVLVHGDSWTKVRLHADNRIGWVATRYLTFYNQPTS